MAPDDRVGQTVRCPDCQHDIAVLDPRKNHRGWLVLAFGVVGPICAFTPATFIVGLPLAMMAWIWGRNDLKEMRAGRMNPAGKRMTQFGFTLGVIGTVMNSLWLILPCLYFSFLVILIVVSGKR